MEVILSSPKAQLELLERFQEQETKAIERELEQLQRELGQSTADLRHVDQEVDDARVKASELPVLQEKLKGLAELAGPDAARINTAHSAKGQRAREEKVPELIRLATQILLRHMPPTHAPFLPAFPAPI